MTAAVGLRLPIVLSTSGYQFSVSRGRKYVLSGVSLRGGGARGNGCMRCGYGLAVPSSLPSIVARVRCPMRVACSKLGCPVIPVGAGT